jgi:hypothetical protein
MKVSIVRGGGLAGLVETTTVDSASLAAEDARMLRAKVEESGLLDLPERIGGPTRQPDQFSYKLTFEDQGRMHTVYVSEENLPEPLDSFISWVSSVPGRQERIGPPG